MKREKGRDTEEDTKIQKKKKGGGVHYQYICSSQYNFKKRKNSLSNHRCHKTCYNFSQIVCQWFS